MVCWCWWSYYWPRFRMLLIKWISVSRSLATGLSMTSESDEMESEYVKIRKHRLVLVGKIWKVSMSFLSRGTRPKGKNLYWICVSLPSTGRLWNWRRERSSSRKTNNLNTAFTKRFTALKTQVKNSNLPFQEKPTSWKTTQHCFP